MQLVQQTVMLSILCHEIIHCTTFTSITIQSSGYSLNAKSQSSENMSITEAYSREMLNISTWQSTKICVILDIHKKMQLKETTWKCTVYHIQEYYRHNSLIQNKSTEMHEIPIKWMHTIYIYTHIYICMHQNNKVSKKEAKAKAPQSSLHKKDDGRHSLNMIHTE